MHTAWHFHKGWSLVHVCALYWRPRPGSKFDRAYFGALIADLLDCLIFTKNWAWWLHQGQKLSLISCPIYSLWRWTPTFYSIRRWMASKRPVASVSTVGIVVTTPRFYSVHVHNVQQMLLLFVTWRPFVPILSLSICNRNSVYAQCSTRCGWSKSMLSSVHGLWHF